MVLILADEQLFQLYPLSSECQQSKSKSCCLLLTLAHKSAITCSQNQHRVRWGVKSPTVFFRNCYTMTENLHNQLWLFLYLLLDQQQTKYFWSIEIAPDPRTWEKYQELPVNIGREQTREEVNYEVQEHPHHVLNKLAKITKNSCHGKRCK